MFVVTRQCKKKKKKVRFYTLLFTTSLKAAYNRLPLLSPQQTPCEVGEAESALAELLLEYCD